MRSWPVEPGTTDSYTDLYGLMGTDFDVNMESPWLKGINIHV